MKEGALIAAAKSSGQRMTPLERRAASRGSAIEGVELFDQGTRL